MVTCLHDKSPCHLCTGAGEGGSSIVASTLAWTYSARIDRLRFMHLVQPKNLDEPMAEEVTGIAGVASDTP